MKLKILIVDDHREMVELITRYVEPVASRIDSADNLKDALRMASDNVYNIVVFDLLMPGSTKEDALHAIRALKEKDCAVIVVSGIPDPKLKDEVMAAGADVFLPKDNNFGSRALLIATHIATAKLPKGAYKSDSFLQHVAVLRSMVENPA